MLQQILLRHVARLLDRPVSHDRVIITDDLHWEAPALQLDLIADWPVPGVRLDRLHPAQLSRPRLREAESRARLHLRQLRLAWPSC